MAELRGVGVEHLGHAVEPGGGLGDAPCPGAGHQDIDAPAQRPRGAHGLRHGRRERPIGVLGEK